MGKSSDKIKDKMAKGKFIAFLFIILFTLIVCRTVLAEFPESDPDIVLTSNIILREDSELGCRMMGGDDSIPYFVEGDGKIISPLEREYQNYVGDPNDTTGIYLFEGEQIIFDIQIYVGGDIRYRFGDAFITISSGVANGRGTPIASCKITNREREDEGILDFHCVSEIGSRDDVWGEFVIEAVVSEYGLDLLE